MAKRNITIDDLARMVQREFKEVNQKLNRLDKNDQTILKRLQGVVYHHEFDDLKMRVKRLEDLLVVNNKKN